MSQSKAYFAFYPGDYLADTMTLSLEEHGVYLLMLLHYSVRGPIPVATLEDRKELLQMTKLGGHSKYHQDKMLQKISKYFVKKSGMLHNPRMDRENAKRLEKVKKASKAADARWSKSDAPSIANKNKNKKTPSSDTIVSGDRRADFDPKPLQKTEPKKLNMWDVAVSYGIARSHMGKWIKEKGEPRVRELILEVMTKDPADPKAYITAALQERVRAKRLYVPQADDDLVKFAQQNNFRGPGKTESYHDYRQALWTLVKQAESKS